MDHSKTQLILPQPSNSAPLRAGTSSWPVIGRSAALKVHSQAEKQRRERINTHLSTLRRMVPDASKMDKASLLGRVIEYVKELKRKATEISKGSSIPTETNEVMVESRITTDSKSFLIKASVCCEDHPELLMNLMRAFDGLRLRAVTADITCLGGRAQTVFILCANGQGSSTVSINSLKESLKSALTRIANSYDMMSVDASSSKRQRLLQSCYSAVTI